MKEKESRFKKDPAIITNKAPTEKEVRDKREFKKPHNFSIHFSTGFIHNVTSTVNLPFMLWNEKSVLDTWFYCGFKELNIYFRMKDVIAILDLGESSDKEETKFTENRTK